MRLPYVFSLTALLFFVQLDSLALCQTNAQLMSRPAVTAGDFELIGGWRVPATFVNGLSMGFTKGGLTSRVVSGQRRFITTHHHYSLAVQEFGVEKPMGTGVDVNAWPLLTPTNFWPGGYSAVQNRDGATYLMGVHWDEASQRLFISGRSGYATAPQGSDFLMSLGLDTPGSPDIRGPISVSNTRMQTHGGGFCAIPNWFADAYLNGSTLGIGCGGYESGQDSGHGPSLTATKANGFDDRSGIPLLYFPWNGSLSQRERRPPDYTSTLSWQPPPSGRTGYCGVDRVRGGGVWIDTPTKQGLCFVLRQPTSNVDYTWQNDTFSAESAQRLYVYHPSRIAMVASGQLKTFEARGSFYNWIGNVPGVVAGMWFEPNEQVVYVLNIFAYRNGLEIYPVVAAYRIKP